MPSGPVNVSTTLPRGNLPRGVKYSRIHTRSCFSMISSFWSVLERNLSVVASRSCLVGHSIASWIGCLVCLVVDWSCGSVNEWPPKKEGVGVSVNVSITSQVHESWSWVDEAFSSYYISWKNILGKSVRSSMQKKDSSDDRNETFLLLAEIRSRWWVTRLNSAEVWLLFHLCWYLRVVSCFAYMRRQSMLSFPKELVKEIHVVPWIYELLSSNLLLSAWR